MLCFHIFPLHRYLSGAGNHQKKSHKKWQKNLHLNIHIIQTPDRQYGVLTHIDDFKGFLTS